MSNQSKPRQSRVQGGWASNNHNTRNKNKAGISSHFGNSPKWMTQKTEALPTSDRYFYEPQDEDLKEKKELKTILESGTYDISSEPSGISRIRFIYNFLESQIADRLFDEMYHTFPWEQHYGIHDGHRYIQPRLNVFYSDVSYTYSGTVHPATAEWPECLLEVKRLIEDNTGMKCNGVLGNLYRNEKDSVAWHSDDEPELGPNPTVVSVSLGATRNFYLRKNPTDQKSEDYTYSEHYKIPLPHGSLLIMEGSTQDDWQHCIPKEYHSRGPRINLTFRSFITDST